MALPGNHDIGSDARLMAKQPVDDARLDRWRRHLGPGRGVTDLPGWRIVGLNSEVMATGHAEEAAQAGFIRDSLAGLGERRIALFLHRPPYLAPVDEPWSLWAVGPEGRAARSRRCSSIPRCAWSASGHIHLHHEVRRGPAAHAWAPALSFTVPPADQAGLPGNRTPRRAAAPAARGSCRDGPGGTRGAGSGEHRRRAGPDLPASVSVLAPPCAPGCRRYGPAPSEPLDGADPRRRA